MGKVTEEERKAQYAKEYWEWVDYELSQEFEDGPLEINPLEEEF